ncbi:MAG: sensor histidine kinase [Tannerellaceae bacterium]|jgi:signal transduction histidine kinase|nr:sensor histidine kinase [Tannerellaceae bacterium]
MKKLYLSCLCLFFFTVLAAQEMNPETGRIIDSLNHILDTQKLPAAEKLRIFKELGHATRFLPELCLANAHRILRTIAEEGVDDKALTVYSTSTIGMCHLLLGHYDSARAYLKEALPLAYEIRDEYDIVRITNNIANTYALEGTYVEALKYYLEGLQQCEKLQSGGDTANYVRLSANIAETYYMMGNEDQALRYADRAIEVCRPVAGGTLNHLYSQACWIVSSISLSHDELDKAEEYASKSWQSTLAHDMIPRCFCAEVLARIHAKRGNYEKALEYAQTSLDYAERLGDPNSYVKAYNALSAVYFGQKLYARAEQAALQALEKHPHAFDIEPNLAYTIALANLRRGNLQKAESYLKTYNEISRSNNSNNFHNALASMEIQYETRGKEMRIAALESEKRLYGGIGLASVVILILISGIFFFLQQNSRQRGKINRQQIKQMEQEKQIEIARSIIRTERDVQKKIAGELHDSLGSMLTLIGLNLSDTGDNRKIRGMLEHTIDELHRISRGLMPPSLHQGLRTALEDFCLKIPNASFHFYGEEERLSESMELFLWRCTNELVNNALKYSGAEKINVQLVQETGRLSLTVRDNGCGFDPEAPTPGSGLRNLKSRISLHNGELCILSSAGNGTEVNIRIRVNQPYRKR